MNILKEEGKNRKVNNGKRQNRLGVEGRGVSPIRNEL